MSGGLLFSRTNARARRWSVGVAVTALTGCWVVGLTGAGAAAASGTLSTSTCHLAAPYQHVIYIQFDNQHLEQHHPTGDGCRAVG